MGMVRRATESDVDWLLSQLKDFSCFYGTKRHLFPEDDTNARNLLLGLIQGHVVLIAEVNGKPAGTIGGTLSGHPFNPAIRTLGEIFWWVSEEYRRTRAGLELD